MSNQEHLILLKNKVYLETMKCQKTINNHFLQEVKLQAQVNCLPYTKNYQYKMKIKILIMQN